MKKRIFSILLTLALLLGTVVFTAIPASAVVHNYGIYVGGIQVNDDNAADVLEDGTVSYDPTTNTLTLNNAMITDYWSSAECNRKSNVLREEQAPPLRHNDINFFAVVLV